jgi:hypothetical protein
MNCCYEESVIGIMDQSVSPKNILTWLFLLAALFLVWLGKAGKIKIAYVLSCLLGVPAIIALIFFLTLLSGNTRWN